MADVVSPLSSDTFLIEPSIHGVTLVLRHGPHLFPAVLSDQLIEEWIAKLQLELAGLAPEMKTQLRRINETPIF